MRNGTAGRLAALAAGAAAACVFSAVAPSLAAPPSGCHQLHGTVTCEFAYTGAEQQLTIPADVNSVHVSLTGAAGGAGNSGGALPGVGGSASGDLSVTGGETLYVEVGGEGGAGILGTGGAGGFNGGADGGIGRGGGGGGGATDLRTVSCGPDCPGDAGSLASRLIVAGGGGGAAGNASAGSGDGGNAGSAGEGGFLSTNPTGGAGGGGGATSSAGGAAGAASFCGGGGDANGFAGDPGQLGSGGAGATGAPAFGGGIVTNSATAGGGGGGGGAYGGGGGGSTGTDTQCGAGGGGGGSSSASGGVTNASLGLASASDPAGVTITYAAPASSSKTYYVAQGGSAATCAASSQANPFPTIQQALACAGDGDVIKVAPSDTPYPGIGAVTANLTIEAGSGGNARNVRVDLSQPDESSGTLSVPAGSSVEVDGLTLDCVSHACVNPNVTNNGELVLRGDTITGAGKAVAVQNVTNGAVGAKLSVFGSTIAHNTNDYGAADTTLGGAIQSDNFGGPDSTIALVNSTVADNTSGGVGGGIAAFFGGKITLTNTTIVGNRALSPLGGGGIYVPAGADADTVTMSNTLISDNLADAGGGPDCDGTVADGPGGHNLIADPTRCHGVVDGHDGDRFAVAGPGVSPIGNFGGPTDTAALENTSKAIGNGDPTTCASDPVAGSDQRGVDRKAGTRGSCDIGAFDTGGAGGQQFHTWYVAPGGAAGACAGNSAAQPFATIQQALGCAGDGDVVILAPSGSTPYPGVGEIDHNVSIQTAGGADARSVRIDLSQPDNDAGPMYIPDTVSAEVDGVTLDCASHACQHPNVSNEGTLTLRGVEITGAGLAPAISNNSVGLKHADLTVLGSAIVHNTDAQDLGGQAGGISSAGGPAAIVTVANTTIADNASTGTGQGGGIFPISTVLTLENVTITGNHASGFFGGGGIYVPAGGASNTVLMSNTLIAGNTADHMGTDCQGPLGDGPGKHNVIGDASQCTGVIDGGGNQLGAGDAGIGTLGYNGGPTETVPLEDGNAGVGAGDIGTCEDALVADADQRGIQRHTGARGTCNVGAWDSAGDANSAPSISVSTPSDGAHYAQGSAVKAAYSCTDPDGAGDVKTCHGDVADGGSLDTSTVGAHSFSVQAEDWAGHGATKTIGYTVDAGPASPPPGGGGGGGSQQPGAGGKGPVASRLADLTLSQRVSRRHLRVGQKVTFTLIARNHGPSRATHVVLSAVLPRSLKLVSVHRVHGVRCTRRARRLTCHATSIRSGATLRIRFVARAVRAGRSHLRLRVTAREHDPKPRNNKRAPKTSIKH